MSNHETMGQLIERVWGIDNWKTLPIDDKINYRYNYARTIKNRLRRDYGIIDAKQQTKKDEQDKQSESV